jgi:hypothetical protein
VTNPAAWHPDPTSAHEYRWWDGTRWTEHVADGGQASIDPLAGPADPAADAGTADPTAESAGSSSLGRSDQDGVDSDVGAAWQQPEGSESATTAGQPGQAAGPRAEQTWQQPGQEWQQSTEPSGGGAGQPPTWQQAPAWSQPGGGQPATTGTNGIAIAAMVIGIIALLISWIPILGALAGILALVLGFVGRSKARREPATGGNGPAITGIVTGILATLISIVATIAIFAFGSTFLGSFETYEECLEQGGTEEECEQELERDILDRFSQ